MVKIFGDRKAKLKIKRYYWCKLKH